MKAAILIENLRILCDECEHLFPGDPREWHNKPCPKCGQGVLVNDEELAAFNAMMAMVESLNEALGPMPEDTSPTETEFHIIERRKVKCRIR